MKEQEEIKLHSFYMKEVFRQILYRHFWMSGY